MGGEDNGQKETAGSGSRRPRIEHVDNGTVGANRNKRGLRNSGRLGRATTGTR